MCIGEEAAQLPKFVCVGQGRPVFLDRRITRQPHLQLFQEIHYNRMHASQWDITHLRLFWLACRGTGRRHIDTYIRFIQNVGPRRPIGTLFSTG